MAKFIKLRQHDGNKKRRKKTSEVYVNPEQITAIVSRVGTIGTDNLLMGSRNLGNIMEEPEEILALIDGKVPVKKTRRRATRTKTTKENK